MRHTIPFARSQPLASESTFKPDGPHGSHTPPRPTGPTGGNATTLRAQYGGTSADSTMREEAVREWHYVLPPAAPLFPTRTRA